MKDRYIKYFIRLILIIVFIGLIVGFGYLYNQNREITGKNNEATTKRLVKKISKFMVLPAGLPTLATVTDKTKLNTQPFFKDAENGDKVLIYPESQKVILFRPSKGKIIEVANASAMVNADQQQALSSQTQPQSSQVTPSNITVAIFNGTTTSGLTKKTETDLSKVQNLTIGVKTVAGKTDYNETKVIDISNKAGSKINEIANAVNGKIEPLPAGENKPDADVLIIIGQK